MMAFTRSAAASVSDRTLGFTLAMTAPSFVMAGLDPAIQFPSKASLLL
jgi:hypothetical protein